jgi:hypothetical protein
MGEYSKRGIATPTKSPFPYEILQIPHDYRGEADALFDVV